MHAKMYVLFETNSGTPPPGGGLTGPRVCAYESNKEPTSSFLNPQTCWLGSLLRAGINSTGNLKKGPQISWMRVRMR